MKKDRGFTLIELLVVIAIIGILSSVVLASLNSARQKSRDARRVSDIKQLQLALELYFDSNGSYPATVGWDTALTSGGFIASVPTPPAGASQSAYDYAQVSSGTSYHLGATLEDSGHSALPGANTTDGFNGVNGTCAQSTGTDTCYDVTP